MKPISLTKRELDYCNEENISPVEYLKGKRDFLRKKKQGATGKALWPMNWKKIEPDGKFRTAPWSVTLSSMASRARQLRMNITLDDQNVDPNEGYRFEPYSVSRKRCDIELEKLQRSVKKSKS